MGRTKQQKADYDRERKREQIKERRFTKPLKIFFQTKYPDLYKEYEKFFNEMNNKYPRKRDLTKSEIFKNFLNTVQTTTSLRDTVQTTTSLRDAIQIFSDIEPVQTITPSWDGIGISFNNSVQTTTPSRDAIGITLNNPVQTTTPSWDGIGISFNNSVQTTTPSRDAIGITLNNPVQTTTSSNIINFSDIEPVQTTTSSRRDVVQTITSSQDVVQTITLSQDAVQTITSSRDVVQTTSSLISNICDELFGTGGLDQYIDHIENLDEGIDVNILDELRLDFEPFDFEQETADF